MSRRRLPEIPTRALRDYEGSAHVPAVWRRLKAELGEERPSVRRSALIWVWVPALSALLFGSGVFVGARFIRPRALPGVQAEPEAVPARAAGVAPPKNTVEPEASAPQAKALHTRVRRPANTGAVVAEPLGYAT